MRKLLPLLLIAVTALAVLAPSALSARSRTAGVRDFAFSPHRLTVNRGTTVVWRFHGPSRHNVRVVHGPRHFHSASRFSGTYRHRMTASGTYRLECTIHPFMTMTLRVR